MWYGIGILYEEFSSYEHAVQAFTAALNMDQKFDKNVEICERLGNIYKHLKEYDKALQSYMEIQNYRSVLSNDISLKIGECYQLLDKFDEAADYYKKILMVYILSIIHSQAR